MKITDLIREAHYNLSNSTRLPAPLTTDDTITVFHNFRREENAITAVTQGLSGAKAMGRAYSYEADNNPYGLFVSPDFKTVDEFGDTIIEFIVKVSELESPVWPGGGFTGQGELAQYWGSDRAGRAKRKTAQKTLSVKYREDTTLPDEIKMSDDPLLAYMLTEFGERQALFIGHLNPKRIKRMFVRKDNTRNAWEEITITEFLERTKNKSVSGSSTRPKWFSPEDDFNETEMFDGIKTMIKGTSDEKVLKTLETIWRGQFANKRTDKSKYFSSYMQKYMWPKQMPAAFKWFSRKFKT